MAVIALARAITLAGFEASYIASCILLGMAAVEDLESQFEKAAERMRSNTALSVSNEHKLQLYGYFKQVRSGVVRFSSRLHAAC